MLLWQGLHPLHATCSQKSFLPALLYHARPHFKLSFQGTHGHGGTNLPFAAASIPAGAILGFCRQVFPPEMGRAGRREQPCQQPSRA